MKMETVLFVLQPDGCVCVCVRFAPPESRSTTRCVGTQAMWRLLRKADCLQHHIIRKGASAIDHTSTIFSAA